MTGTVGILAWANHVLGQAGTPSAAEGNDPAMAKPAVFILGLPRSWTTLLYQVLTSRLRVGYPNNIVARFWNCPEVGIALSQECIPPDAAGDQALQSDLGRTPGPAGPHEFGYFWSKWFGLRPGRPHELTVAERAAVDIKGLGTALCRMERCFQLPLVFKNTTFSFQARLIRQAYPNSLFVRIERDPWETGRSLLAARYRLHGTYDQWLSLAPGGWPHEVPNAGPAAEVAWQIRTSSRRTDEELAPLDPLVLNYDALLSDPEAAVASVCYRLDAMGMRPDTQGSPLRPIPKPPAPSLPDYLLNQLRRHLDCPSEDTGCG